MGRLEHVLVRVAGRQRALSGERLGWIDARDYAIAAAAAPGRTILGLCGAPGAGKSTLANALVAEV